MKKDILDVAGCVIEFNRKVLVLKRAKHDSSPGMLGFPAGKIDDNETSLQAVLREVYEETGLKLSDHIRFIYVDDWEIGKRIIRFYTYYTKLYGKNYDIKLDFKEHSDFLWLTPEELYVRNDTLEGFNDVLEKIYGKERFVK